MTNRIGDIHLSRDGFVARATCDQRLAVGIYAFRKAIHERFLG